MAMMGIAKSVKEELIANFWTEWMDVPMMTLLIDNDFEYALNTDTSDTSFHFTCDNLLSRPTSFNKSFLATFPLLENKPTIVVGTPENTGKSPIDWTVTLLHEHFHQLQFSKPNYFSAQKALNLDKGDQTGMWMLNHPFPYEDDQVNSQIKVMALNLLSEDSIGAHIILEKHKDLKQKLKSKIGDEHYRYLNLQLWQEGFARYIEMELVTEWIENFDQIDQDRFRLEEIQNLKENQNEEITYHLIKSSPKELKRIYFYALGAAEARLINRVNPEWKSHYFDQLFTTDHLLR